MHGDGRSARYIHNDTSTFPASVGITSAVIPMVTANHMVKPKVRVWGGIIYL